MSDKTVHRPKTNHKSSIYVNHAAMLLLIVGFLYQSYQLISTFVADKTAVTHSYEHVDVQTLPAVSFCPGFRESAVINDHNWLLAFWDDALVDVITSDYALLSSPIDLVEMWENVTLELEDFLHDVYYQLEDTEHDYNSTDLVDKEAEHVKVEQHETTSGKCFTLHFSIAMQSHQAIYLSFNLSHLEGRSLPVHFHHPQSKIGLNSNYWTSPATTYMLKPQSSVEVLLTKHRMQRIIEEKIYEEDTLACYEKRMKDINFEGIDDCSPPCYAPVFDSVTNIAGGDQLPQCQTIGQFICMAQMVENLLSLTTGPKTNPCVDPINETKFTLTVREDASTILTSDRALLSLGFHTTSVTVEEETKMMNSFEMVSAIGGSLGMFLGGSFLYATNIIISNLEKFGILK